MKLIKLSDTHYIVVNDSEIKEGNWYWTPIKRSIEQCVKKLLIIKGGQNDIEQLKITHSTQPDKGMENVTFISLSEVEEAIYGYSMEKAAYNFCDNVVHPRDETRSLFFAFCTGFNAHKELVKDKLFTIEDMKKSFNVGYDLNTWEQLNIPKDEREYLNEHDYIQSLLPKTEWECTIDEQGKITIL